MRVQFNSETRWTFHPGALTKVRTDQGAWPELEMLQLAIEPAVVGHKGSQASAKEINCCCKAAVLGRVEQALRAETGSCRLGELGY